VRKIIMLNRVTLDGFFAGPNGEIDWFIPDSEIDKKLIEEGKAGTPDTVLFGRATYEMFESYWPEVAKGATNLNYSPKDEEGQAAERKIADSLAKMRKIVFSKTLKKVNWENTAVFSGDLIGEVKRLKKENVSDMIIFGSGTIVQQLTSAGLIDDYWFIVTPVILGAGKSLFSGVKKVGLQFVEAEYFKSGNVVLHYKTKEAS
jgi:dihydrofolate reductase